MGDPFSGAEALLEDLPGAEAALERLAELPGAERLGPDRFRVDVRGTTVLVRALGESWEILAPAGADLSDAMSAARRLHGWVGSAPEGWDLDR